MKKGNIILLGAFLVLTDLITKYLFYQSKEGFANPGGLFGLFHNFSLFILAISSLCLIFLIYYYTKTKIKNQKFALMFIIAGITGNLLDRLIFGYVRDFIDLKIWPVFNLADAFTTIGVIMFMIFLFREEKHVKSAHFH